jgi:prevent-host-death family protein
MSTLTVTETRREFTKIPERLAKKKSGKVLQVTNNGKPVLAVMPWETYQRMQTTMRILGNPKAMQDIRDFEAAEKAGTLKEYKWADLKIELGI